MTKTRKKTLAVLMALSVVIPGSIAPTSEAAAKKVKLSKTKVSIQVGKTKKITIKNAKKGAKVTWKTSNKKVVKIVKSKKKGKKAYAVIKGAKKGTATLRAIYKVGKKKKTMKCKVKVTKNTANKIATKQPTAPTKKPGSVSSQPTALPTQNIASTTPAVESKSNYSYFDDYTLGYDKDNKKIVAYKDGKQMSLEEAGAKVYNNYGDNIFASQIADNKWNADNIKLTAPLQYTTEDGKVHDINSMLTNYDFIADPTALDNSDNDGKLYVYGTNEGFDYADGKLAANSYSNNSLSILSTSDMVNWTDEGTMDNTNLNNLPSTASAKKKEKNGWTTKAWAPSALKIDGDGDCEDEYYIFYTDGGGIGYVRGDSPVGPWHDDLGQKMFTSKSKGCEGVKWCFDPAVLADDKGNAYIYFGGGNDEEKYVQTGRVCKLKFEKGTGIVSPDGIPKTLDTFCFFEDGEINQIDGKYIYSYCTNWDVKEDTPYVGAVQIAAYVSSDPMNICFFPDKIGKTKFTDEENVEHNYLGTILDNPSKSVSYTHLTLPTTSRV